MSIASTPQPGPSIEPYPPSSEDEILPGLPSDPIPNPEPESPFLPIPDPGIYEGEIGTR